MLCAWLKYNNIGIYFHAWTRWLHITINLDTIQFMLTRRVAVVPYATDHLRNRWSGWRPVHDESTGRRRGGIIAETKSLKIDSRRSTADLIHRGARRESRVDYTQTVRADHIPLGAQPGLDTVAGLRCARVLQRTQQIRNHWRIHSGWDCRALTGGPVRAKTVAR